MIEWISAVDSTVDPDVLRENYKKALQRITEQCYTIPLFTWVSNYAFSKDLDFKAWPDEIPRFYMTKWK